jgi:hypothetical protein
VVGLINCFELSFESNHSFFGFCCFWSFAASRCCSSFLRNRFGPVRSAATSAIWSAARRLLVNSSGASVVGLHRPSLLQCSSVFRCTSALYIAEHTPPIASGERLLRLGN